MTDQPPLSDDDLSLALDGEADAQLQARIDTSPEAQARLDELRAAQDLLAASSAPALDDDVVDELISTAVDTPVAPARRGTGGQRRAAPWIVAASVILLMAVGLSLVWAGRSDDQDQASASRTAQDAPIEKSTSSSPSADSAFSEAANADTGGTAAGETRTGGHGSPTTIVPPATASTAVPVLYLGAYETGGDLRTATATSLGDAWKNSQSGLSFDAPDAESTGRKTGLSAENPPSKASVDRCGEQLQVTLKMKQPAIQTGYATVGNRDVLVYEFATTSAKDADRETTLVAAVGAAACDEVVIFER